MAKFVGGVQLVKAMEDEDYVPIFQRGKKAVKKKDGHEDLFAKWGGDTIS